MMYSERHRPDLEEYHEPTARLDCVARPDQKLAGLYLFATI
jgi:hypothetical protein